MRGAISWKNWTSRSPRKLTARSGYRAATRFRSGSLDTDCCAVGGMTKRRSSFSTTSSALSNCGRTGWAPSLLPKPNLLRSRKKQSPRTPLPSPRWRSTKASSCGWIGSSPRRLIPKPSRRRPWNPAAATAFPFRNSVDGWSVSLTMWRDSEKLLLSLARRLLQPKPLQPKPLT